MSAIGEFICRVVASELRKESDATLLRRFLTARDEAAFATVVRRHGPMVYRVCRGVLRNESDAEDAAQAAFLVLAQHAGRVRRHDALPSWLHGVALRTARKLRTSIARRRATEARAPVPPRAGPEDLTVREAGEVLHEELEKLPARYKGPLVLCYLQGKTHDEAAAELGWTVAVFRGRLERARKRLRDRLGRRGLAPGAAPLAGALAEARPALSATFAVTTARAAVAPPQSAVAGRLVSPAVSQLAREVLRNMSLTPLKVAGPLALAAVLAACGWLFVMAPAPAAPPPEQPRAEPAPTPRAEDRADKILVCRNTEFARLKPNGAGLLTVGGAFGDGYCIAEHRLSPDGKSVAYRHQTPEGPALSVWQLDQPWPGNVLTTSFFTHFFWMPDGKNLALCGWGQPKDGLPSDYKFRLVEVATGKAKDLTMPEGHWLTDVSPDGKWFLTMKYVDPKNGKTGARLYRVEHPGGKALLLYDKVTLMILPRWRVSPDGKQVAGMMLDDNRRLQVFAGDLNGKPLRQVTHEALRVSNFFGWSPSGKKLLYECDKGPAAPKEGEAYHQVFVSVDAEGRNREELYDNEAHYISQGRRSAVDLVSWAEWR